MLNLPQSTEVKRQLPKAQLYKQFGWSASQREAFDAVVSRIDLVNWIAPRTLPAIAEGAEVKAIAVAEVTLKSRDFDIKPIAMLAKAIPQRIIYVLRFEEEAMIAVYYMRLFTTPRQPLVGTSLRDVALPLNDSTEITTAHTEGISLHIRGLNLDMVWENIVRQIVGTSLRDVSTLQPGSHDIQTASQQPIRHAEGMSLQEQIIAADERSKLLRQIEALERKMRSTAQPRRKREIFQLIQNLKGKLI